MENSPQQAPASLPRHPRRDVTYTALHCVLMGNANLASIEKRKGGMLGNEETSGKGTYCLCKSGPVHNFNSVNSVNTIEDYIV